MKNKNRVFLFLAIILLLGAILVNKSYFSGLEKIIGEINIKKAEASSILEWDRSVGPSCSNNVCGWGNSFSGGSQDISLTHITLDLTGVPSEISKMEACIGLYRDSVDPKYIGINIGGYNEVMCWNSIRDANKGNWHVDMDLTNTPLYIPKDTSLFCNSNLNNPNLSSTNANFSCNITYKSYQSGDPRYRSLRLPYFDRYVNSDGTLPRTYYISSDIFPLHVKAVNLYQNLDGTMSVGQQCLRWLRQGGEQVQQACFPDQSLSPGTGYDSPPLQNIDWTLPSSDLLTATAQCSPTGGDIGYYALVEIPPAIIANPENIVRDYGNVPPNALHDYCIESVTGLPLSYYPYFCNGNDCSDQTRINNCVAQFSRASCMADNSCNIDTTPPAAPSGLSVK